MVNNLTVSVVSKILYNFYKNYINNFTYYNLRFPLKNGRYSHITIDILRDIQDFSNGGYPEAAKTITTEEEAFASNYNLIPMFYNSEESNTWKSHVIVPKNIFLQILWSNIFYKFINYRILNPNSLYICDYITEEDSSYDLSLSFHDHDNEEFKSLKKACYRFLTHNLESFSTEKDALIILDNVKLLINYIYQNYEDPKDTKLRLELKNLKKVQKNSNRLKKDYSSLKEAFNSLNDNYISLKKQYECLSNNNDNISNEVCNISKSLKDLEEKLDDIHRFIRLKSDDYK
ncbi:MAG: hypothetical protein Q4G05_02560 [Clostridia bacterium]|nr:hypothetical protein [Clostridia bacterium]